MSILIARVDERLIHGQVATAWLKSYPAQITIVVDDEAAKDSFQIMLLQMAVSGRMKCVVTSEVDAKQIIGKYSKYKLFLCTKSIATILKLLKQGIEIPHINIGGLYAREGRTQYYSTIYLDEKMKKDILALEEFGYLVEYRTVPQSTQIDIIKELKER